MSVKKKDTYVEVSVFCPECKQNLKINVDYSHRESAIRFPFEYVYIHGNPQHGLALYLDKQMQVRGTEVLRNINLGEQEVVEMKLVPERKGKISPMARSLGMISQLEFELLELSDGNNSIYSIAQKKKMDINAVNGAFKRLEERSLINIKKI